MASKTFLQAIRDAQYEEMARDAAVFVMGEDVECNMFGTTTGMIADFGAERVRDTPIAEAGMAGVAAGAAMVGMRPIVDFTIAPFLYPAMDQIISIIAKSRYLYGGQAKVPVVLRANLIYGNGNAAQHSDRPYSMFMHMPGLKIMVPSSAYEMKGLMKSAIRDDDPVLSFEDVSLWSTKSEIPDEEYLIPFGKANRVREGKDCTIVAIGAMMNHALGAAEALAEEGIGVEIIDPRTLAPLDSATILESVRKTGRLVVVDSAFGRCSAASEIAAIVSDEGFWDLRAPIVRVTTENTHIPFSSSLEAQLYPSKDKVIAAVRRTLS
ncbi:MAG: alpha-ketoacid dehydrogenase subunit beta [Alphaproteobacteria bacterium]|nr:alpha-ketoacid dehydrogenase subunit beta [Alphaproteobacteria bacterium]